MNRQVGLFTLLIGAFVFAGCDQGSSPADNGTTGWSSLPVKIYADASLLNAPGGEQDFTDAMAFWEQKAGRKLFDYQGAWSGQAPYSGAPGNVGTVLNNVILFQNPWPYPANIAGQTTVQWSNNDIQAAIVQINGDAVLCPGDCPSGGSTSQRRTIAHELGHFLGLSHVQDTANIMYPQVQPGHTLSDQQVDTAALEIVTAGR